MKKIVKRRSNRILLVFAAIFAVLLIIGFVFDKESVTPEINPNNLTPEVLESFSGLNTEILTSKYGEKELVSDTNSLFDTYYIDSANISIAVNKNNNIVWFAGLGEAAAIEYITSFIEQKDEMILSQFNGLRGYHKNLTKLIKQSMNDPSSFENLETNYWDFGDHLVVATSYTGKNAFGGRVRGFVKAKVDLNGNVIEIMHEE